MCVGVAVNLLWIVNAIAEGECCRDLLVTPSRVAGADLLLGRNVAGCRPALGVERGKPGRSHSDRVAYDWGFSGYIWFLRKLEDVRCGYLHQRRAYWSVRFTPFGYRDTRVVARVVSAGVGEGAPAAWRRGTVARRGPGWRVAGLRRRRSLASLASRRRGERGLGEGRLASRPGPGRAAESAAESSLGRVGSLPRLARVGARMGGRGCRLSQVGTEIFRKYGY